MLDIALELIDRSAGVCSLTIVGALFQRKSNSMWLASHVSEFWNSEFWKENEWRITVEHMTEMISLFKRNVSLDTDFNYLKKQEEHVSNTWTRNK